MSGSGRRERGADVVILTAIALEYRAALQVEAGALKGSRWEEETGPNGLQVAFRAFQARGRRPLRVAVVQAGGMGAVSATNALLPLVEAYRPRCVAMCGVCAGRPGKTNLGDVIAVDRLFFHDTGKRLPRSVQRDLTTYNLRDDWKVALERFDFSARFQGVLPPFQVHVAPMGSGNQVIEDETVWRSISGHMRKTLGLDMEAAALGSLAHVQRDRKLDVLVMKGVMDFANRGRDDHHKEFAARASAECLLAFLREHLHLEVLPDTDDLLWSGTEARLPEDPAPSVLLNARYEVVPFHAQGREKLLAELDRWCDEGPPAAVRLLHAEGGVGKTRFAIEWLRHRGGEWAAGFLAKDAPEDWFERLWSRGQSVLVVIDYAESRSDLCAALLRVHRYARQAQEGAGVFRRVRLLLLARNDGDWWESLRQSDPGLGEWLGKAPRDELRPLAMEERERERVFHEAAEEFARLRGRAYDKRVPVPLSDERFGRVLYLHMAALASVEGLAFEANTLMDVILDHEERLWEARAGQDDLVLARRRFLARQLVAAATLRGGLADASTASRVLERLLGRPPDEQQEVLLRLLHRIYQRTDKARRTADARLMGEEPAVFLPGLEPDLLGEGMVLRVASPRLQEDRLAPDWIERVFPADEQPRVVATGLEVLGRASATRPEAVRPWLDRLLAGALLRPRARLALEAAKAVGRRTEFSVLGEVLAGRLQAEGDVELARELEAVGIPPSSVSLHKVVRWTSRTLLNALPASGAEWVSKERALHLHIQSLRPGYLGTDEEALDSVSESVRLCRELAQREPEAFRPELLAGRLNSQGKILSQLGRHEEALAVFHEAADIYVELTQRDPDVDLSGLAMIAGNISMVLAALGHHEDALKSATYALELYEDHLAQHDSGEFLSGLATTLGNRGLLLSDLGRHEEAVELTRRSVEILRELARSDPDTFGPDLGVGLKNLGTLLSRLRRDEEALELTSQVVDYFRPLARRNPEAFEPHLAMGLNNLSATLANLGRLEKALEAGRETVELYRVLKQRGPDAFGLLATSLTNVGVTLSLLGRQEEALAATLEAVELQRDLARRHPGVFRPVLANSLDTLSKRWRDLGRHEEVLKTTREQVELHRELVRRDPGAYRPELARCVYNLGCRLLDLDHSEETLAVTREAVKLYRVLARRDPDRFRPDLAASLNNLGCASRLLGRRKEALARAEEALDMLWPFFERRPEDFAEDAWAMLGHLQALYESSRRRLPSVLRKRIAAFERLKAS